MIRFFQKTQKDMEVEIRLKEICRWLKVIIIMISEYLNYKKNLMKMNKFKKIKKKIIE